MVHEHLEHFVALAKEKHFGRAAEICNVTQPTLSWSIRQLEGALGVMLVRRDSRFRGLTPEGERVLLWARRILADTKAMREEIRTARCELSGRIRIAVIPTALEIVEKITKPLIEKHPGVIFSVLSATSAEIPALLRNFDIEVGSTYLDTESLGNVVSVPLYCARYYLLTADAGPLKDLETTTWADAARLPLCLLSCDGHVSASIEKHLALDAQPVLESNSLDVLFSHIREGSWSSVMPLNLAQTTFSPSIRAIPIVDPSLTHSVGLVAAQREPNSPLVAALLAQAKRLSGTMKGSDTAMATAAK